MARLAPLLVGLMACYASHEVADDPRPDATVGPTDGGPRDAGPRDGGRRDGGPTVEGPVIMDCATALESGREGQRCAFEGSCRSSDLCTAVDAGCWDGRLRHMRWTYDEGLALEPCATATGMAGVVGTTPAGPIELTHAWASHSHAFSVDAVLVAHDGESESTCSTDRLGFWIGPLGGSYLGVHDVLVQVTTGAIETTIVPGVFEVFETDDAPFIGGNLTVDHGEWQLEGFIAASPCDALDRSGP